MIYCHTDHSVTLRNGLTIVNIILISLLQLLVLSQVDRVLDEVDWLIAKKKSQTAAAKSVSGKKLFILMFSWINGERREGMHR